MRSRDSSLIGGIRAFREMALHWSTCVSGAKINNASLLPIVSFSFWNFRPPALLEITGKSFSRNPSNLPLSSLFPQISPIFSNSFLNPFLETLQISTFIPIPPNLSGILKFLYKSLSRNPSNLPLSSPFPQISPIFSNSFINPFLETLQIFHFHPHSPKSPRYFQIPL